jgi:hypothetical protein
MPSQGEPDRDARARIETTEPPDVIVRRTIEALSKACEVYQRGGVLVDIIREPELDGAFIVPLGMPRARVTPVPVLTLELSRAAMFVQRRKVDGEWTWIEVPPPKHVAKLIADLGEWGHMGPLEMVVSWPVLRPDGSLFDSRGYDLRARCYSSRSTALELPQCITSRHVEQAVALLYDLVADFPFKEPVHFSSWLATLLTLIARPAIRGPVPMLIIDASAPGSGKTLLADLIGMILMGLPVARRQAPENEDEWRKSMLGIALGAYPVVLLDNIKGKLRSAALDATLTGEVLQERLLGSNTEVSLAMRTTFIATSNNAAIDLDLTRRSLHCRIVVDEEYPERREGFRHPLPAYALEHRNALLRAACIILLGYQQAGRPAVKRRVPGSFERWGETVQAAVVWAGLPDPMASQGYLRELDSERDDQGTVLNTWVELYRDQRLTLNRVIADLLHDQSPQALALRDALSGLSKSGKLETKAIQYTFRRWKDRQCDGLVLRAGEKTKHGVTWTVETVRAKVEE